MKFVIQTWKDNPILRKISDNVESHEIKKFISLWEEMVKIIKNPDTNWVWLAAPQIGINKRIICVSLLKTYDDKSYKTIFMINPKIISYSDDYEIDNEWCLSVPKKFWDVARAKDIKVRYIDNKWKDVVLSLSWISSRIVQHEIDHLEWILFVDKIIEDEQDLPLKYTF